MADEPIVRGPNWAELWAEERNSHHDDQIKAIYAAITAIQEAADRQATNGTLLHDQRFEGQEKALLSAFEAQQAALAASEKVLAAALQAAKDAVDKAEVANDRRFAALGDKIDGIVALIQLDQGRNAAEERRSQVRMTVPVIVFGAITAMLGIAGFIFALAK